MFNLCMLGALKHHSEFGPPFEFTWSILCEWRISVSPMPACPRYTLEHVDPSVVIVWIFLE